MPDPNETSADSPYNTDSVITVHSLERPTTGDHIDVRIGGVRITADDRGDQPDVTVEDGVQVVHVTLDDGRIADVDVLGP